MATKSVKDDFIRVRVTKEHKENLKKLANDKSTTVSEIIVVATKKLIEEQEQKEKNKESIEKRVVDTEKKLQEIKGKLEERSKKRGFLDKLIYFRK